MWETKGNNIKPHSLQRLVKRVEGLLNSSSLISKLGIELKEN